MFFILPVLTKLLKQINTDYRLCNVKILFSRFIDR